MQPNIEKDSATQEQGPDSTRQNSPEKGQAETWALAEEFRLQLGDVNSLEELKNALSVMQARVDEAQANEKNVTSETGNDVQKEDIRSAMQFTRETYEGQSAAVTEAIKRHDELKQQFGPDDPRVIDAKNQWDYTDRARAETGDVIADYIQKFPDHADVFEAVQREDQAGSVKEKGDSVSEPGNGVIEDVVVEAADPVEGASKGDESTAEQSEEIPIEERLEAPNTEMFQKYGETMRRSADTLVEAVTKMNGKWNELVAAGGAELRPDLWEEWQTLNDERNKLNSAIKSGAGVLKYPDRKTNESFSEGESRNHKLREEYEQTAKSDPYTVMRLAEAGQLVFRDTMDENAKFASASLRGNSEFMSQILKSLPNNKQAEGFWSQITGEAAQDRDLYIHSIQRSPLNYQYGSSTWKNDPDIQKIALESGLDPIYLEK